MHLFYTVIEYNKMVIEFDTQVYFMKNVIYWKSMEINWHNKHSQLCKQTSTKVCKVGPTSALSKNKEDSDWRLNADGETKANGIHS